eukprot:539338-Amorphochlora_amoeboformis.AAC.2
MVYVCVAHQSLVSDDPTPWLRKQRILDNNIYDRTNKHVSKAEAIAMQVEKAMEYRRDRIQNQNKVNLFHYNT